MRRLLVFLAVSGFLLSIGGTATALTATPDPAIFDNGKRAGEIDIIDVTGTTITFKVKLTGAGSKLSRLDVTGRDGGTMDLLRPLFASSVGGLVKKIKVKNDPEDCFKKQKENKCQVQYSFKKFQVGKDKDAPPSAMIMTQNLFIEYEELDVGDMIFFTLRGGAKTDLVQVTIVPEPGTLMMLGLGLGGLALASRRHVA